jgi:DNA-binding response OmpR family regulator
MITAYDDEERRSRAARFGASDFLAKPIDFDGLKAKISSMVGGGGAH